MAAAESTASARVADEEAAAASGTTTSTMKGGAEAVPASSRRLPTASFKSIRAFIRTKKTQWIDFFTGVIVDRPWTVLWWTFVAFAICMGLVIAVGTKQTVPSEYEWEKPFDKFSMRRDMIRDAEDQVDAAFLPERADQTYEWYFFYDADPRNHANKCEGPLGLTNALDIQAMCEAEREIWRRDKYVDKFCFLEDGVCRTPSDSVVTLMYGEDPSTPLVEANYFTQNCPLLDQAEIDARWAMMRDDFASYNFYFDENAARRGWPCKARSLLYVGTPLAGKDEVSEWDDRQYNKIKKQLINRAHSDLIAKYNMKAAPLRSVYLDRARAGEAGRKFDVLWWNSFLEDEQFTDAVDSDFTFAIASILFVWIWLMVHTGSPVVGSASMLQILFSLPLSLFFYRVVLQLKYISIMQNLVIFVILGIGADDIFVYFDTWNASATHDYKTVAHRMSHVYAHAAVAMGVTSATTILAFLSNLGSPFIGIVTFGVFSALLVTVNYMAVVTFFPCVVLVYDKYLMHRQYWWAPCVAKLTAKLRTLRADRTATTTAPPPTEEAEEATPVGAPPGADDEAADEEEEPVVEDAEQREAAADKKDDDDEDEQGEHPEQGLPKFFKTTYADFIITKRFFVLGGMVGAWVIFLAFATMLTATPFIEYELLPEESNFHQFTVLNNEWFPKTASPLTVHVLFGLDHRDPLSLNGVRPQNFQQEVSGNPQWDESFDLDAASAQVQLVRTAEEFAYAPRSGLKIDVEYGINFQLSETDTGSFDDTPDGGSTSSVQSAYGVQSVFHALGDWENASMPVDTATGEFALKPDGATRSSCRPCFNSFYIQPNPFALDDWKDPETGDVVDDLRLNATDFLIDDCNCVGYFPIPNEVCLKETSGVSDETLYKCSAQDENLPQQLATWLESGTEARYDQKWWEDYIFGIADNDGRYTRMAMYDIQVQTTLRSTETDNVLGLRMAAKWDDWMDDYNSKSENELKVMVYVPSSEGWYVSAQLVPAGISNMVLSLFLAWLVLNIATFNWIISSLATATIGIICTIILGWIQVLGWGLGPLESILIVIVVGFSVDYTVHLADSYIGSKSPNRFEKVRDALGHTGASVLSGAISTISASLPMFGAQIIFFFKFGVFVFLTIFFSLVYSLMFFAAALCVVGPLGTQGHFSNFYGGCVASMHEHMGELEEENQAVKRAAAVAEKEKLIDESGDAAPADSV
mmetsp:Transcript_8463/g.34825  ORF Transcript_8463/g.34825 Transcript_8463/m.34825 type:complete len:1206 (+) Transcript_8463:235-3852(+)